MNSSVHKGRQASQWLAAPPKTGQCAAQFALNPHADRGIGVNSGVAINVATGRQNPRPYSALP